MSLFLMRLRGILKKEALQILRDPSSIALALVMPLVLLFIFGYGVNLDAEHIPVAIVSNSKSEISRDLIGRFELSTNFEVHRVESVKVAEELIQSRDIDAIIHLQSDFSARMLGGAPDGKLQAPVQLIVHGIDANRARLIESYVQSVIGKWAEIRRARNETAAVPLVSISPRIWYNEGAESRNFMVPGLIALIMTLTGILLTSLVVAREWERGTMEAMLVTPLRRMEILLGKILPYYLLGMLGMGMSVVVAITVFQVPFRGSILALLVLSSLFMLASLGFGLLLSAAIRIQFVAAQVSIVAGFLPAFFLSGLVFDLESTPKFIQIVSLIVPARYFVTISHTLFMAGDVWSVLLPNGLVLALMSVVFLSLSYRKISKRLEG
jgi:ABC-type multidrug transport system permease subunit